MIFITDYIEDTSIERKIFFPFKLFKWSDKKIPFDEIQVLLVWHQKIDRNFLKKFPSLKGIVRYGVGYDNIDIKTCNKMNIIFCNNPDYGVDEVSETALSMILNLVRGVSYYNELTKYLIIKNSLNWQENTNKNLRRSKSLSLGIIGIGRIGISLALKSKHIFDKIGFYDPYVPRGIEKSLNLFRYNNMEEILNLSDIISLHVPLSNETQNIVDSNFIKMMKDNSILINTARGGLISDFELIIKNLENNKLFGVGLDVLNSEPPDHKTTNLLSNWLRNKGNFANRLIINPHTSYYSNESYYEMRVKASENALRIINNIKPYNIIS